MSTPTLREYYNELATHDWWYEMSDDNSKFLAGDKKQRRLDRLKNSSPEHRSLYYAMMLYHKHGEGNEPVRPE